MESKHRVRFPLPGRIGAYLVCSGLILDLITHHWLSFEYVFPGVGIFTYLLLFPATPLLIGTGLLHFIHFHNKRDAWIPLTPSGREPDILDLGNSPRVFDPNKLLDLQSTYPGLNLAVALGLMLIALGSSVGFSYWVTTRTYVPLDIPVFLAEGHIKTPDFFVNLNRRFYVNVNLDYEIYGHTSCHQDALLEWQWTLFRGGKSLGVIDRSYWARSFDATPGRYSVDIEIPDDPSCLNSFHPRIVVSTDSYGDKKWLSVIRWNSLFLSLCGTGLLMVASVRWVGRHRLREQAIVAYASVNREYYPAVPRIREAFWGLPPFGIIAIFCVLIALIPLWVLQSAWHNTARGLFVSLLKPALSAPGTDRWTGPLVVHLKDTGLGREPQLYVGSNTVEWYKLNDALKLELSRRAEWVVYVSGDPDIAWADVVYVADIAHQLHAKVILLTAKTAIAQ